ncbi:hypothetical protein FB567DRAFT_586779 [Paraphoma chrysanthemicola]|uniref:Aminoglycoside phosphotransferase domain-containing protein n=1 Tax=Paraphoma chrysanthemicola TaxID=798071 RepID=A0A8K0RHI2_9PLEO|nr:hypothetical protein FB567DRAFT_586779 [Paraphoma chrysanthemicola]
MNVELREGISRQLDTKDESVIDARLQELKTNFPDGAPYVLTHSDLILGSIMVTQGKIAAIIDWELAGYYPWWVEMYTSHVRSFNYESSRDLWDIVWKELGLSTEEIWGKKCWFRTYRGEILTVYGKPENGAFIVSCQWYITTQEEQFYYFQDVTA